MKFSITTTLFILLIVAIGFVGYTLMDSGSEHVSRQLESELAEVMQEKDQKIASLELKIDELQAQLANETVVTETPTETTAPATGVLADLQSLKSRGIVLEPGSSGTDVKKIQAFLNTYFNTSGGIDGDFGPTTRKRVEQFQKDQKIGIDGGVGSGTLGKMISWMESR